MAGRSSRGTGAPGAGRARRSAIQRDAASALSRDVDAPQLLGHRNHSREGRKWIAAIGIDCYRDQPLRNAVNDAREVLSAFEDAGFRRVGEPLFDAAATHDALIKLVTVGLEQVVACGDSLVVFFAGHGHTFAPAFDDRVPYRKGYLFPVDADPRQRNTWLDLDSWLSHITILPPLHILVILDSCYSGLALDDARRRSLGPQQYAEDEPVQGRVSRRVIASAMNNQRAMDNGPVAGHSLFAGCLLQALRGELHAETGKPEATGERLGVHIKDKVRSYSARQVPLVGTLDFHDDGELFVPLVPPPRRSRSSLTCDSAIDPTMTLTPSADHAVEPGLRDVEGEGPRSVASARSRSAGQVSERGDAEAARYAVDAPTKALRSGRQTSALPPRSEGWVLDPALVARLDHQDAERARGGQVLSVLGGDALATQTAWATWAARRGYLTLITDAQDITSATNDLLAQIPWLRCLPVARRRLAAAARIDVNAVDAALDTRAQRESQRWIDAVGALDDHARVSGWLLAALRNPSAKVPDLATAPVQGGELLAIACDLACPTAVLVQRPEPDAAWLERALAVAAGLITHLPRRAVAVAAPDELVTTVLRSARDSRTRTLAQQGRIALAEPVQRVPGRGRRHTVRALYDALASDSRTRGRFELEREVSLAPGGPAIDVDLLAPRARIAVAIDSWHHFYDFEGYRRDRICDLRMQRAGYFVLRFLAEDVDLQLASIIDQIALALGARRTQGGLS